MIRKYLDLSEAEKEVLRTYLRDMLNFSHPDVQAMDRAIVSPLFADGNGMLVCVEEGRVLGTIGVVSKEIETKGELYLTWLSAVETREELADELVDVALAYATQMNPQKIRLGVAPRFTHFQDRLAKRHFQLKDQAVILEKRAHKATLPEQYRAVPLSEENKALFLELRNPSFRAAPNSDVIGEEDLQERIDKLEDEPCGIFYDGELPVGVYQLSLADKTGTVEEIAVSTEMQGRGYGRALITFVENVLVDLGVESIELLVFTSNKSAITLYEKQGYVRKRLVSTWFDYLG